ncbi:MAG: glycoside hydrolase family 16 protein [Actinomycetes bacterium]
MYRRLALVGGAVVAVLLAAVIIWLPNSNHDHTSDRPADPEDWTLIFEDHFAGPSVVAPNGQPWFAYSGMPGGNPKGWWDPKNLVVGDGQMLLKTVRQGSTWVTAGAGNRIPQTFGRWEVRMKMPYSPSVKFVVQLWPSEGWPPEIDFAERGGPNGYSAFMHWGTRADQKPGSKLQTFDRLTGIDMNDWHDVGVMWRPNLVQYTIDGQIWASVAGANVPAQPMWLAIQTEGTQPALDGDPQPPSMQVSWVKIWSWTPGGASPSPSPSR